MKRYELDGVSDCWMEEDEDGQYLDRDEVIKALVSLDMHPHEAADACEVLGISESEYVDALRSQE